MRTSTNLFCPLKVGYCAEPVNCGSCLHLLEVAAGTSWKCAECVLPEDPAQPFYHVGHCNSCGEHRQMLIFIAALDPAPPAAGAAPEEEQAE